MSRKRSPRGGRISFKFTAFFAIIIAASTAGFYGCSRENTPTGGVQKQEQSASNPGKEHFDKGVQLSLKGQLDEAIKEYELTLKYNPKSSEAYNNIGFAYFDKGDMDKAVENQRKAVEVNPNLANGYYGLAMALEKKGDKEGAIANWKEFAKLSQPHTKWWTKAQDHIKALEKGSGKKAENKKG